MLKSREEKGQPLSDCVADNCKPFVNVDAVATGVLVAGFEEDLEAVVPSAKGDGGVRVCGGRLSSIGFKDLLVLEAALEADCPALGLKLTDCGVLLALRILEIDMPGKILEHTVLRGKLLPLEAGALMFSAI